MTIDPFAQPNGAPSIDPSDPFGQPAGGGGSFPKPAELFGELLLITPLAVESVPDTYAKNKPGEPIQMKDRLTADTVVLTGERAGEEFDAMWWSQGPVVKAGQAALRKGVKAILGRLYRFPINEDKKAGKYTTRQDLEMALASWKPGMPNVRIAWALEQFTAEDAQIARAYLASKQPVNPFATAA